MSFTTADLYDDNSDLVRVAEPIFKLYGGNTSFTGEIVTLKLFEDNSILRKTLEQDGKGKVLVVDGGGSTRVALVGDQMAGLAIQNGWQGLVIYGCIRDSQKINTMAIGIKAIGTCPARSIKRGEGEVGKPIRFAGLLFQTGEFLYSDEDGILISATPLE